MGSPDPIQLDRRSANVWPKMPLKKCYECLRTTGPPSTDWHHLMSDQSETARRDAFEDDVRTALFRPGGELQQLQFRLMGFAVGLALLVLLAPAWFVNHSSRQTIAVSSGTSLFGLTPGEEAPMGVLGTVLLLTYLLLALSLLLLPPDTTYALVAGIVGLVVTLVILVNQPQTSADVDWTGAPFVALGFWLLTIVLSGIARSSVRRS
jgi:hypothetical protein